MPQVREASQQITIGELAKWSVEDRCEFVLNGDAELLKRACTEGALHAQCRESGFVRRLAWGIAFNVYEQSQAGRALLGKKPRLYSEVWPAESLWSEVWGWLCELCDKKRRSSVAAPILDAAGSPDAERYLHHLARSISCEQRNDWQPPEARPVDPDAAGAAFSTLINLHQDQMLKFVKSRLPGKSRIDHDALVNEVFIEALKQHWSQDSVNRFTGPSKISTLLLGIARNLCVNHLRERKSVTIISDEVDDPPQPCPPSDAEMAEARRRVAGWLKELDQRHRLAMYLHRKRGIAQKVLADRFGVSVPAISQWIAKAEAHIEARLARENR